MGGYFPKAVVCKSSGGSFLIAGIVSAAAQEPDSWGGGHGGNGGASPDAGIAGKRGAVAHEGDGGMGGAGFDGTAGGAGGEHGEIISMSGQLGSEIEGESGFAE